MIRLESNAQPNSCETHQTARATTGSPRCRWSRWVIERDGRGEALVRHLQPPASTSASSSSARRSTTDVANLVVAQTAAPRVVDPDRDHRDVHQLPPAAVVYSGLAIYDTMRFIRPDVATVCCGVAIVDGLAAARRAARRGKRASLPKRPRPDPPAPTAAFRARRVDIEIHAREALAPAPPPRGDLRRAHRQAGGRDQRGHRARPVPHAPRRPRSSASSTGS